MRPKDMPGARPRLAAEIEEAYLAKRQAVFQHQQRPVLEGSPVLVPLHNFPIGATLWLSGKYWVMKLPKRAGIKS